LYQGYVYYNILTVDAFSNILMTAGIYFFLSGNTHHYSWRY